MEMASGVLKGWRMLVIDDDKDSLNLLCMVFGHFGAEVIQVPNGVDGLRQLAERHYTVVLCDLSMPKLDGWNFIRQVRQAGIAEDVPIIAVTAHAMTHETDRVIEAGFSDRIVKPIDDTEGLVRRVIDVVRRHQSAGRQ